MSCACRRFRPALIVLSLLIVFFLSSWSAAAKKVTLSERYQKWLEEEVGWIITKVERDVFMTLTTDTDRDRFIEQFWAVRDPSPGTPENECKTEHYRRLEFANQRYGESGPGWRTDRGRMYILLGKPNQVFDWTDSYNLYPVELWFYSGHNHPSLPNSFYVMFWQREGAGDFKLYSPYNDGPEKLVHATFSGRSQSYQYLRSLNGDLARASLTLIPTEPVDVQNLSPSLTSDVLLASVAGLPEAETDTPYLRKFDPNVKLKEKVTTRLGYDISPMQAVFLPVSDGSGKTVLHYAFQLAPENLSLVRMKDQYYVSLHVSLELSDESGNTLLRHDRDFIRYFSEKEFATVRSSPLLFEDKVGLTHGRYRADLVVFNNVTVQNFRAGRTLEIPTAPPEAPSFGPVVAMEAHEPARLDPGQGSCFTFFQYRFRPQIEKTLRPTETLNILFQLACPRQLAASPLTLEYRFVKSGTEGVLALSESLPAERLGQAGNLLTYKQLSLKDVPAGRQVLVISLKEASGKALASTQLAVNVDPMARRPSPKVIEPESVSPDEGGLFDYHRSLILAKRGDSTAARSSLEQAVRKDPGATLPALAYAENLLRTGDAKSAVSQVERVRPNQDFPAWGILLLGKVQVALGQKDVALETLALFRKSALPTKDQLAELAAAYRTLGREDLAREMEKR